MASDVVPFRVGLAVGPASEGAPPVSGQRHPLIKGRVAVWRTWEIRGKPFSRWSKAASNERRWRSIPPAMTASIAIYIFGRDVRI